MPEQENFQEIVELKWLTEQPEGAIARLLSQLEALERRFGEVSRAADAAGRAAGGAAGIVGTQPAPGYSAQVNYRSNATGRIVSASEGTGFSNVTRSGETPSGIGAQYIPEGSRRRYTTRWETDTPEDLDRQVASRQASEAASRRSVAALGEAMARQDWQSMMSRLAAQGHQPGSYGYEPNDAYRSNQMWDKIGMNQPGMDNGAIVPFGHDFSNSPTSSKKLFEDLGKFNSQASEELSYYKNLWRGMTGGDSDMSLIAMNRGLSGIKNELLYNKIHYGDVVGGPLEGYQGVGFGPNIINGTFRYASTAVGQYTGGLVPPGSMGGYGAGPQIPLPPVGWYAAPPGGAGGFAGGGGAGLPGPNGPYTMRGFANEAMRLVQEQAAAQYGAGNYAGFESTMQNLYNPMRWEQARRGATVGSFETEYDLNQVGGLAGGAGRYSKQAYLGYQISDIESKLKSATLSGNAADVDRFGKSLKDAKDRYADLGDETGIFNNKFLRHIAWIGQGILIWGALHAAIDGVKTVLGEVVNLQNVQARSGFISGEGFGDVSGDIASASRYGINSATSGQGTVVGGQLGLNKARMEEGRQLALVFGTDQYTNALRELYQTEQRANAVGLDHVNIMGYIASAYKEAPGTLESYFDSLQQGILLSHDLGVSAEAAGLAILRMAEATEDSPERIATTLQSVVSNLRQGQTQDDLKAYGITPGDAPDMLRQVSAEVSRLVAGGELEKAKSLIDQVTGGLNAPARRLQLLTDFQELNKLFTDSNQSLADMNLLLAGIGNTGEATYTRLTAGAIAYLDALIAAGLASPPAPGALGVAGGSGESVLSSETNRLNYKTQTGLDSQIRTVDPNLGSHHYEDTPAYKQWLREQSGVSNSLSDPDKWKSKPGNFGPNGSGGTGGPPAPTYEFGGFQTAGAGWDWKKFESDVRNQEKLLGGVKGYSVDQKEVAFWDEATQSYKMMIGDLNAIRFATDEQRKLLQQQITGTFNVPAGGEALVQYFALANNIGPSTGGGAKAGSGGGTTVTGSNNSWGNVINNYINGGNGYGGTGGSLSENPLADPYNGIPGYDGDPTTGGGKAYGNVLGKHSSRAALLAPGGGGSSTGSVPDKFRKSSNEQSNKLGGLVVNNTIRVYIDGRQVSHAVQRQNYRSFENIRNSAFSAPSNQVAI